jgi:hypothetical protein
MDPDVFITIAFCAEVALFAIGGGVFVWHEWRREALGFGADQQELSRLSRSRRLAHERIEGPTIAPRRRVTLGREPRPAAGP